METESFINSKLFWITAIVAGVYLYLKYVVFRYWQRHNIPHEKPIIPVGNLLPAFTGHTLGNFVKANYEKFKKNRFHGIYMMHKPFIMINDPELIRQVLVKEFNKFPDRGLYLNEKADPLAAHLFLLNGDKWRNLRTKLSPSFTSGKLKQMFPLLQEIGEELTTSLDTYVGSDNIVEMKDFLARYTTDSISSIAFGFNCNSLKDPKSDFRKYGKMVTDVNPIKNAMVIFAPSILEMLNISFTPKPVENFFKKVFSDMVSLRREENTQRKDFLSLLMQLIDHSESPTSNGNGLMSNGLKDQTQDQKIQLIEACAQAYVFFVAGFETTSSAVTYCLYELARNPDIQEKLQEEIDEVAKSSSGMTYDAILRMEYLHMAFSETMRKHSTLPFLNRICVEDFRIPDSEFTIPKGMGVLISVSGLHLDPEIFPDPEKFDPTRFSKENMSTRHPYVYLPFGDGPRICIGSRFGLIQSKIALFYLLHHFKFSVCEKTPIPIAYSTRTPVQAPEGGVYLRVEKRKC